MATQNEFGYDLWQVPAAPIDPWGHDADSHQWDGLISAYTEAQNGADDVDLPLPVAPRPAPKPPLIVRLANGHTAIVEHPDWPDYRRGKGGFGIVYCAEVYDQSGEPLGRHALKQSWSTEAAMGHGEGRIPAEIVEHEPATDRLTATLRRETAIMQHIYQRGIARRGRAGVPYTITHGEDHEHAYMLQQLAGGETVRAHLDSGAPLPTLQIMRELLETVTDMEDTSSSAGHESEFSELGGLVYHDLKPENVTYDPDTGDTYLLDGGIALGSLETGSNPATVRGTSIWMAPEQCRGAHNLLQTNQYQLALIWLELRTKGGYSNMRYEMNHERRIYTYAYQTESDLHWEGINKLMMDHDIPYEEQRIMLRALQNDPTKRWESTGAMLDAYLEYTSQLALFTPRPSETPAFRHVRLVAADTADMQTLPLALVRRDPVSAPVR